ncbi:excisionase family DNA-binding protein [Rhodococcus opacus]|nr:excisionase family DNA-binding protein [Rhodococcus opacus]
MLTTQEAAELLGITRPTLVRLLEAGKISYSSPGRHRRVELADVLAFRQHERARRGQVFEVRFPRFSGDLSTWLR